MGDRRELWYYPTVVPSFGETSVIEQNNPSEDSKQQFIIIVHRNALSQRICHGDVCGAVQGFITPINQIAGQ
jgi:hypothetical protein